MEIRKWAAVTLSVLAISAGFTSCSSDDDEWDWKTEGSTIEMKETRAFILNEGSMNNNNANLTYFDWTTDAAYPNDIFMKQNGIAMGDVAQDIIVDDDNIFIIMSGSKRIYKLNGVGVRKADVSVSLDLGDPRYGVIDNGNLYVTCYGGYVAKYDTKDLTFKGSVKVGDNPEYIVKEGGKLYCTCSGWGKDNRVAAIDIKSFDKANYFTVMDNPDRIISVSGKLFVQGYGADWSYPWGLLDTAKGTFIQLGNCSAWTAYRNTLYLCNSVTDWSTYETTSTFYTYDVNSGKLNDSFLKNAPQKLTSSSVYGMSTNEKTGDIYVLTTDFTTAGHLYHFKSDGTFLNDFPTTGVNPRKVVFLD